MSRRLSALYGLERLARARFVESRKADWCTLSLAVTTTAILINILNPKLSIFFLAFLPQFVRADEPHLLARMLELSGVFMAMTFVVFVVYGPVRGVGATTLCRGRRVLTWMRRILPARLLRRRQTGFRRS